MSKISKLIAFLISLLIILLISFFLFLRLIQITPNEKKIVNTSNHIKNLVDISYNNIGIPQIEAANINDLYFGIGYVQAENRMWQMDLLRRMASGKLSEIFGEKYITYDKFVRFFDLSKISKTTLNNLPSDLKSILISYSQGVNSFIQDNSENLAIEFSIFNYTPQNWKPGDCLLVFNFLDFLNNSSFKDNLYDLILNERLSQQEYESIIGNSIPNISVDTNTQKNLPKKISTKYKSLKNLLDSISNFPFLFHPSYGNTFAIRKPKGQGYRSIIATDCANNLTIPSPTMSIIAKSPEIAINGIYLPGIPFAFFGKNTNLSWAINFVNSNRWQFDEIKLDKNKSNFVAEDSTLKKVVYITDTIFVKNSYPRLFYLKYVNGKGIFTEAFRDIEMNYVANSPIDLLSNRAFQSLYELNFTQKIEEIDKITSKWLLPTSNLIFSDENGNIGLLGLGSSFIDNKHKQTKNLSYTKFINPSNKFIISTNKAIDTSFKNNWITNYRSKRIASFLSNLADFELRDIKNIQLDAKSDFAKEFLNLIIPIIQDKIYLLNKQEQEVFQLLKNWDFSYTRNQKQPVVLEELIITILFKTFSDNLDNNQIYYFYDTWDFYEKFLKVINNKFSQIFDDLNTPQVENRDYIIFTSAKQTFQKLSRYIGKSIKSQYSNWGKYIKCGFSHFEHSNKLVGATFLIDTIDVNGHRTCVSSFWNNKISKISFGIVNRLIIDNQFNGLYFINCLGNSGDPTNDHFLDQLQVWKNGGYIKIQYDNRVNKTTNKRIFKPSN